MFVSYIIKIIWKLKIKKDINRRMEKGEGKGRGKKQKRYSGIESTRQIIYILNHNNFTKWGEKGRVMGCIIEDKKNIPKRQVFSASQILCFVHA